MKHTQKTSLKSHWLPVYVEKVIPCSQTEILHCQGGQNSAISHIIQLTLICCFKSSSNFWKTSSLAPVISTSSGATTTKTASMSFALRDGGIYNNKYMH